MAEQPNPPEATQKDTDQLLADEPDEGSATEAIDAVEPPDDREHIVVVGYDAWTPPVIDELERIGCSVSLLVPDDIITERFDQYDCTVIASEEFDESAFAAADIDRASSVLIATLDDQLNVLAVLTVRNIDEEIDVLSFAGEARDVPKLERAGADTVISLGRVVGELLVDVAVDERAVEDIVAELIEEVR